MSEKSADKPVIFNEAEQLELQQLQQQNDSFNSWGQAITRSLHCGQDSLLVANLIQFFKNMIAQNTKSIEAVSTNAKARIAAEAAAKSEEKKAS